MVPAGHPCGGAMLDTMVERQQLAGEIRPLKRREYDRLVELGVFENERIELLRGQLVTMSPQGEPHASITARLGRKLSRDLDETFEVRQHSPFAASDDSEPEPDISVSRARKRGFYHPSRALLLIEVSESSLRIDRDIKAAIYAENGAAEYWIVDIRAHAVWVFTKPIAGVYRGVAKLGRGDRLVPTKLPEISIAIKDLFATR